MNLLSAAVFAMCANSVKGLSLGPKVTPQQYNTSPSTRRSILHQISGIGLATPLLYNSGAIAVDAQFAEVGQQERPPSGESPFVKLANGVQVKDFREGSGAAVGKGSKVELTLKGRLLNLNGVSLLRSRIHFISSVAYHQCKRAFDHS